MAAAADGGLVQLLGGAGRQGHTTEHLREAVDVTVRGAGSQVEIQMGHFCNNRCVFCVSGQLTEQGLAPKIGLGPIVAALEAAAARGVTRVTFLGGEPTIQPSFLPALKAALELGFDDVTIFTNGVRTWKTRFMEEVCALGRFTWRFSIQGGDAATHDEVVGRKGAFARIERGLAWLQERGQDVTVNLCVTELSRRSLPAYAPLLTGYGVRQLHVDVVRPANAGVRDEAHWARILPTWTDLAGDLRAMLAAFDALDPDFDVNLGNLPYCVLSEHADRIQHGGEPTATVTTDGRGRLGRVWDKYAHQQAGMVFAEGCAGCGFRDACRGVPEEYAALHGLAELTPLPASRRVEADRERDARRRRGRGDRRGPGGRLGTGDGTRDGAAVGLLRGVARAKRLRASGSFGGWTWGGSRRDGDAVVVTFEGPARFSVRLDGAAARFEVEAEGEEASHAARPGIEAVAAALRRSSG